MRGRWGLGVTAFAALCLLGPGSSRAAAPASCSWDVSSGVMDVAVADGGTTVRRGGSGTSPDDPILVDGARCGDATVSNTDRIRVGARNWYDPLRVSLAGGPLAPGRTDEPGGSDEIEIDPGGSALAGRWIDRVVVDGSAGHDHVAVGPDGTNLNADEADGSDADIVANGRYADVDAAGGDDTVAVTGGSYLPVAVTFRGGDGADRLTGGAGWGDTLDGGAGDDVLDGGAHDATMTGGAGNDTLLGGGGVDTLAGGPGDDVVDGGGQPESTADVASFSGATGAVVATLPGGLVDDGQGGVDVLRNVEGLEGGAGDDTLRGTDGADVLWGGAGDDDLAGLGGGDWMLGGDGDDRVDAGPGDDIGSGEAGDDALAGGDGDDTLVGGSGDDAFDGGAGEDEANLDDARAVVADLSADEARYLDDGAVEPLAGVEDLRAPGNQRSLLVGDDGPNRLALFPGTVRGGGGDDDLYAGRADYTQAPGPISGAPAALQDGQGGIDVIETNYSIVGSRFDDHIERFTYADGGPGDDDIVGTGSAGSDHLDGGPGNDRITASYGDDVLIGGPGGDVLDGGDGLDHADYSGAAAGVVVDLAAGAAAPDGDGGSDDLTGVEAVTGSAFDDVVVGDGALNWLDGGAGGDRLDGAGGDDRLRGGAGDDVLAGSDGRDILSYDVAGVPGGADVDLALGVADDDGWGDRDVVGGFEVLLGTPHGDTLAGGEGDDTILGDASHGGENDMVSGRGGNDVLVGERVDGGAGDDELDGHVLDYSQDPGGIDADLAALRVRDGYGGSDTIEDFGWYTRLVGSRYADRLVGSAIQDVIDGGAGDDVIRAGAEDDEVDAGPGADDVSAEAGGDVVHLRDGDPDGVTCGDDDDRVDADGENVDDVAGDCEDVSRPEAEPTPTPEGDGSPRPGGDGASAGGASSGGDTSPGGDGSPPSGGAAPSLDSAPPIGGAPLTGSSPTGASSPRPLLSLRLAAPPRRVSRLGRAGLRLRLACDEPCRVSADLRVGERARRALGLGGRRIGHRTARANSDPRTLVLRLSRAARRSLAGARRLRATLRVTAVAGDRRGSRHRLLVLR